MSCPNRVQSTIHTLSARSRWRYEQRIKDLIAYLKQFDASGRKGARGPRSFEIASPAIRPAF